MSGLSYFMPARGGWEAAVPWGGGRCYMGSDGFLDVPDEGAEAEHRAVFVEGL